MADMARRCLWHQTLNVEVTADASLVPGGVDIKTMSLKIEERKQRRVERTGSKLEEARRVVSGAGPKLETIDDDLDGWAKEAIHPT